jgi:hypothetical protein
VHHRFFKDRRDRFYNFAWCASSHENSGGCVKILVTFPYVDDTAVGR